MRSEIPDELLGEGAADEQLMRRLWDKDASLWSDDARQQNAIRDRLGWLNVAESMLVEQESARLFAARVAASDVEHVVLLGMGGSSLCAEVCRRVFDVERFLVLDSTVPAAVCRVANTIDPARALMIVASKSGTTIEVRSLADFFYARTASQVESPGRQFVAITDPGTPLEGLAHELGFAGCWLAPPDIGGRFSALSIFGVLPMALMGIDTTGILQSALAMAASCGPDIAVADNPGARLGLALNDAYAGGRDKLTFLCTSTLSSFGLWAEQLVSESLGKHDKGVVPVAEEPRGDCGDYAGDRTFVAMRIAGEQDDSLEQLLDELEESGHPVMRFVLPYKHALGAEFLRWEIGVAVAGALMDLDPFDQPDVQASKDRTGAILDAQAAGTPMAEPAPLAEGEGWAVFADLERDAELAARQRGSGLGDWLAAHLGRAGIPDYVGLQAFVAPDERTAGSLAELRDTVRSKLGVATTSGFGPSFLHSSGQMHKGGADRGVFLQITADDPEDLDCPGRQYSFGRLARAQAQGDLAALQDRGRRVVRVHLGDAISGLEGLVEVVKRELG